MQTALDLLRSICEYARVAIHQHLSRNRELEQSHECGHWTTYRTKISENVALRRTLIQLSSPRLWDPAMKLLKSDQRTLGHYLWGRPWPFRECRKRRFPQFTDLPLELRRMIWSIALEDTPIVIQAVYIPRRRMYNSCGPPRYVLRRNFLWKIRARVFLAFWRHRTCAVTLRPPQLLPLNTANVPRLWMELMSY
jgi:hypothetical protein